MGKTFTTSKFHIVPTSLNFISSKHKNKEGKKAQEQYGQRKRQIRPYDWIAKSPHPQKNLIYHQKGQFNNRDHNSLPFRETHEQKHIEPTSKTKGGTE